MISAEALTVTNVAALVSVAVVGLKLVHMLSKIEVKVGLLWDRVFGPDGDR